MAEKIFIPFSTDHSGDHIELSETDALNLSPFDEKKEVVLTDSAPYTKAIVSETTVEFVSETAPAVTIDTELVKDTIDKQYYIGQKHSPKQR